MIPIIISRSNKNLPNNFIWKNFNIYQSDYYSYCEVLYNDYNLLILNTDKYREFFDSNNLYQCTLELLKVVKSLNANEKLMTLIPSRSDNQFDSNLYLKGAINFLPFLLYDRRYKFSLTILGQEYDLTSFYQESYNNFCMEATAQKHSLNEQTDKITLTNFVLEDKYHTVNRLLRQYIPIKDCLLSTNDVSLCLPSSSIEKSEFTQLIQSFFSDLYSNQFNSTLTISNFFQQISPNSIPTVVMLDLEVYDQNNYKILSFSELITI